MTGFLGANANFEKPDFAFPQTVIKDAEAQLKAATKPDQGLTRLLAVMEIARAKSDIDDTDNFGVPAFVGEWAAKESDEDIRGLMLLYEARVLSSIYEEDSYQYDRVDAPLLPYPDDLSEWSGLQFRTRRQELVDSALKVLKPYFKEPIGRYAKVISVKKDSETFYSTLGSFAFAEAMELCESNAEEYLNEAIEACAKGTPQWAMWTARKDESYDAMIKLYKEYPEGLCGGYFLYQASENSPYDAWDDEKMEMVDAISDYLAKNPRNIMTDLLKNQFEELTRAHARIEAPSIISPGAETEVVVEYGGTTLIGVEIYRYTDYEYRMQKAPTTIVSMVKKPVTKTLGNARDTLRIRIDRMGMYMLKPICQGVNGKDNRYNNQDIIVTSWLPAMVSFENNNALIVGDYNQGTPAGGVDVSLWNRRANTSSKLGMTNADGCLQFVSPADKKDEYYSSPVVLSNGGNKVIFNNDLNVSRYRPYKREAQNVGSVFVSRPLYHPGDELEWSMVAALKDYETTRTTLLADADFSVILRDANYQPVDTVKVKTDKWGRADGKFSIPTDRLTGRYSIQVQDSKSRRIASADLMVSDFKLPVFELKDIVVDRTDSAYVVKGRAVRYSGAAVPGAEVRVDVQQGRFSFFWFSDWSNVGEPYSGTTLDDGTFAIEIPINALDDGNYRAMVTVTTATADVADGSASFRAGKPYALMGNVSGEINVDSIAKLNVYAYDSKLQRCEIDVLWSLAADDKVAAEGEGRITDKGLELDWSNVPAGIYTLTIEPTDTTLFDKKEFKNVTLYSIKKNSLPESLKLFMPKRNFEDVEGAELSVEIGLGEGGVIYVVAFDKDGKAKVITKKLPTGFSTVNLPLSDSRRQQFAVVRMLDGKVYQEMINVRRPVQTTRLKLEGESWRDKLIPGAPEQWKIKLTDSEGNGYQGAMIATMYNGALNALASLSWPSNLQTILKSSPYWVGLNIQTASNRMISSSIMANLERMYWGGIDEPYFMYLTEGRRIMYDMAYAAAPMAVRGSARMNKQMMSEMATEDAVEGEADEALAGGVNEESQQTFEYRAPETLQAFWMPSISINDKGEAILNFTVPNSIGQWAFRAEAWTEDGYSAEMLSDLTASKPIMVEPSLPRFMRRGDSLRVLATVINNTDEAQQVSTTVEIFDVTTEKVISSQEFKNSLDANAQAIVGINLTAPIEASNIGYRVKSTNGKFTDGEQAFIPVLDASTVAIDSEMFYLTEADPTFTTTIPADKKGDGIVAIQYCQNPVWDAVKSLPGLYDFEPKTATGAAASAYAAFVAKGLLKQYPEIREVLDIWQSNPADSALVSKLEKNEDIKLALLAQTPFVGAANANTQQMQRLALTFNETDINRAIDSAVKKLKALQWANGGFAWGSWSNEASIWITEEVLESFGRLNSLGFAPYNKELKVIIDKAFSYVDSKVDPRYDDYEYTLIYSLYPNRKPSTQAGRTVISKTLQAIVAGWKSDGNATKAVDALILEGNGRHAVAREILRSISEFSKTDAKKGTSIPSVKIVDVYAQILEAYGRIEPQSPMIDGMRQWLILQTQANDDLGAWNPTTLVAAILSTGARWTTLDLNATAAVTIDDAPLTVSKVEAATGAFSDRLEPSSHKRTITFTRPAGSIVSYGSVMTIGTQPLSEVKPASVEDLSISKRFLVERDGQWVETDVFTLGERVRVQLLVKAGRNMEYVTIDDQRPSAFEPVEQMPGWVRTSNVSAYRENGDTNTRLFLGWLPQGTHYFTYDMTAAVEGQFISGVATIQSQYAPELTARSGAKRVEVNQK